MKTRQTFRTLGTSLLLAAGTLFAAASSRAAEEVFISQFNDATALSGWRFDYGGVTNLFEFDPSQDSSNNPASGSLQVTFGFDAAFSGGGTNKGAITIDLGTPIDASTFVTMEMDIKVDIGSVADGSGNSGYFQMVIRNGNSYQFNSQFGANVTTNSGWRHISVPPTGSREAIRAITLELFGGTALTGPVTFHIDNIKFTKPIVTTDVIVDRFDDGLLAAFWRFDYGGVTSLLQFDPTQDAAGNPASGSLKTTLGFNAAALDPSGQNKGAIALDLPSPLAGAAFLTMEMDVKVEPGSAADGFGNSGFFQMIIRNTILYDFISQGGVNVSTNGGWRHVVANLTGAHDDIHAITLELYGGAALTGPVTFYLDNLKFTAPGGGPPPPTMTAERPVRGLNMIPVSGQTQRQNIATVASGFSWIGRPDSVTYSLTIGKYPDASHAGFQTHIFLVPGSPGTASDPDYGQPHVVFLDIQRQGSGGAFAAFRYKVNEPAGNNFLYGQGSLGGVGSAVAEGTWSLRFNQDTNATVTAPDATSASFVLPPAAAALFAGPLTVFIGDQPNSGGNVGQTAIFNSFRITTGGQTLLEDNFLTADVLNPALWQVAAGDPAGVQLVGADALFWLGWTLPDAGFSLQAASNLADPNSWLDPGWTVPLAGAARRVLVHAFTETQLPNKTYAPSPSHAFFRLSKPQ